MACMAALTANRRLIAITADKTIVITVVIISMDIILRNNSSSHVDNNKLLAAEEVVRTTINNRRQREEAALASPKVRLKLAVLVAWMVSAVSEIQEVKVKAKVIVSLWILGLVRCKVANRPVKPVAPAAVAVDPVDIRHRVVLADRTEEIIKNARQFYTKDEFIMVIVRCDISDA